VDALLILPIGTQPVVHGNPFEEGQYPYLLGRFHAPLFVHGVMRELVGTRHVHPHPLAFHAQPRLVEATDYLRRRRRRPSDQQPFLDRFLPLLQPLEAPLGGRIERPRPRRGLPEEIFE
jgi:hypothetical protein